MRFRFLTPIAYKQFPESLSCGSGSLSDFCHIRQYLVFRADRLDPCGSDHGAVNRLLRGIWLQIRKNVVRCKKKDTAGTKRVSRVWHKEEMPVKVYMIPKPYSVEEKAGVPFF